MISIIVPVYKVEDYLPQCLDSILNSTFNDYEIILVDDGSPDNCGRICDSYAARDNRIKVIHNQNQGLSEARNCGLRAATGEYIAFVDSDDTIHPRMLEVLFTALTSGNYDFSMVHWDYAYPQDQNRHNPAIDIESLSKSVIVQDEYIRHLAEMGYSTRQYNIIWNKMYKKSIIDGVLFKTIDPEDVEWLNRVIQRVNQGVYIDVPLYHYTVRQGSIMQTDEKARKFTEIGGFYACLQEIPKDKTDYRAYWLKTLYSNMFHARYLNRNENRLTEVNALVRKI